ncbi:MAG: T9SS type A sorting domain-containing protein [Flavobacteriales bacterium]|nr:T9SS type A sorting domain-containing protein [Flavobacteriales bacterium]
MTYRARIPSAAALMAALALSTASTTPAHAQADAWGVGGATYTVLPESSTGDVSTAPRALPVHPPGTPNAYTGQVAHRSLHIRTAGDGRILFFEVDGNLYDGAGWLMADARGPGCQDCLEPGVMDFLSVPVPGTCHLFYLLSAAASSAEYDGTHIQVSVLDLEADNPRFAGVSPPNGQARRGRLLSFEEIHDHPQFPNWQPQLEQTYYEGLPWPTSERVGVLNTTTLGKTRTPILRVAQKANGDSWLAVVTANRVQLFLINSSGIHPVDPLPNHLNDYVQIFSNSQIQTKAYFRDADAVIATDPDTGQETLVLAMTDGEGMKLWPDQLSSYNLVVHRYNAITGHYQQDRSEAWTLYGNPSGCITAQPTITAPPGPRGCALTADGSGVFVTGERTTDCSTWQAYMEYRAFGGGVIDLTHVFGAAMPAALSRTRIHRNRAPREIDGFEVPPGDAIYLPGGTTVGAVYVEDMEWPFFIPDALQGGQAPLFNTSEAGYYLPRFLNEGVAADSYLSATKRAACCTFLNTHGSGVLGRQELQGSHSWTSTNNPFGNAQVLTLTEDVVVKPGAVLYIGTMTLRFGPNAKLIVERGGRMIGYNSTFTSLTCPGSRWPGMRAEGNTANPYQTDNPALPVDQEQAYIRLQGCTVENARTGVWCARESFLGTSLAGYTGGYVRAYTTTFRNCITGVRVEHYQRRSTTGSVLPNLCEFNSCTFETTGTWPDFGQRTPRAHAELQAVEGIRFSQCKFLNEAPGSFPQLQRGNGILARTAGFYVEGNTTEDASLFKGLTVGVNASTGTTRKASIRRSWFRDNHLGALMQNCTGPEVSRSHFFVPFINSTEYPPTGLVLHQSTAYLVEENNFHTSHANSLNVGLLIHGDVLEENRIYNNSFTGLAAGTYVKDRQKGYDPGVGAEYIGLQLLCSDYTNCGYDYLLGDNTYINARQGEWDEDIYHSQLAGNRFYNGYVPGISISTVQLPGVLAPRFDYYRHSVLECDPHDDSPYFNDIPIGPSYFNKAADCGNGRLQQLGGGGGISGYRLAAAQLRSAKAYFAGTVDTGEKVAIEEAIKQDSPWLPSHTLRDYLLARCPLSDEVLLTLIYRPEQLDPWHLTQVLLENAKLTPGVLEALEKTEQLNPYMMAIVKNAGNGPTVKDLLLQELQMRSTEKAHHLVLAFDEIMSDSTMVAPTDTLYAMLAYAPDGGDLYTLAELAMDQGDHDLAIAWLDSLVAAKDPGQDLLRELADMQKAVGYDWSQANGGQRERLKELAEKTAPGAALAWAISYHLGDTDELPLAQLPVATKSYFPHRPARTTAATERPMVQAHPNPTTGSSMVVIGSGVDEPARLHVTDPSGRLIRTLPIAANQQLLELDLSGLADGLYVLELLVGDMKLGATKLTLQH